MAYEGTMNSEGAAREMTLDEVVGKLPMPHRAHRELAELRTKVRDFEAELTTLHKAQAEADDAPPLDPGPGRERTLEEYVHETLPEGHRARLELSMLRGLQNAAGVLQDVRRTDRLHVATQILCAIVSRVSRDSLPVTNKHDLKAEHQWEMAFNESVVRADGLLKRIERKG